MFLTGPAGAGKTGLATERILELVAAGVAPEQILLLTPQRSYTLHYQDAFDRATWYRLGKATIGGLAGRIVALFWPLVTTQKYPFSGEVAPSFLTYEVAQFFMSQVVSPLIEQGYFTDLRLTRPRLYSQLLDNLNKAAANSIPLEEVGTYLRDAAGLSDDDDHRYEDIAQTIKDYRNYCAQHNLLDFSLYLELFGELLDRSPEVQAYLAGRYKHLVYDNCEEDIPLAHDVVKKILPGLESALILFDNDAGYRRFLGANPASALTLKSSCSAHIDLPEVLGLPEGLRLFGNLLVEEIRGGDLDDVPAEDGNDQRYFVYSDRLHHNMVARAIQQVAALVDDGVAPGDIVVISPFLSDSLHYGLSVELDHHEIRHHVHRPSRDLLDEPTVKILLSFAILAHPHWNLPRPSHEAVTYMLNRLLGDADLVRSALLTSGVYEFVHDGVGLKPFEELSADLRDRITYVVGEQYERLRKWIIGYVDGEDLPIDHFFSRLFGELVSQARFGFYKDLEAGADVGRLVESARKFRQAVSQVLDIEERPVGAAYIEMVQQGVISAFYSINWEDSPDVLLITPVHTFLLKNKSYKHQIWLDVGSTSWHKRIHQPLTNPYVLTRSWRKGQRWSSDLEQFHEVERLSSIMRGLINRCSETLYICFSELSAYGQEQTGVLREVVSNVMRYMAVSVEEGSNGGEV